MFRLIALAVCLVALYQVLKWIEAKTVATAAQLDAATAEARAWLGSLLFHRTGR